MRAEALNRVGNSARTLLMALALAIALCAPIHSRAQKRVPGPTFYRDIQPILEKHCQGCHRPGEIGPMPLIRYDQVRPLARVLADSVASRRMPPWFAAPEVGHFKNDPSLTPSEIAAIRAWAMAGAPAGNAQDAPTPAVWTNGWNIPTPAAVIQMPKPVSIP